MKRAFVITIAALMFAGMTGLWSYADCASAKKGGSEGFLGVYLEEIDDELRESLAYKGDGAFVEDVVEDTPAEKAGIEAGDIIFEYGGKKVMDEDDLRKMIRKTKPGAKVQISVFREGKKKSLAVKIGKRQKQVEKTIRIRSPRKVKVYKNVHPRRIAITTECGKGAFLGVKLEDMSEQLMEYFKVEHGTLVAEVIKETAAEKAGIKAGDVIIEFRQREVEDAGDLSYLVGKREPGDKVEIKVMRDGSVKTFKVELGKRDKDCKIKCGDECLEINLHNMEDKLHHLSDKLKHKLERIEDLDIDIDMDTAD